MRKFKSLIFISRLSIFLLFNICLFSTPLKVGVNTDFNFNLVRFIMDKNPSLDIELVKFEPNKDLNRMLIENEIDINVFQTLDQLNKYNELKDTSIIPIEKTYIELIGIYSKKHNSIKSIKKNSIVAIPNDPSNNERSLLFLEKIGLIKLDHSKKNVTDIDIISNPFDINIVSVNSKLLPRFLEFSDYVILNGDTAFDLEYIPRIDSLFLEKFNKKYINIIASKKKIESKHQVIEFIKLVNSKEVKIFILEKYGNNMKFGGSNE